MIVDTSVWIEFLAGTGSAAAVRLREVIREGALVVVPEVVLMELAVGTTDERAARELRRMLLGFDVAALAPLVDSERAAAIHRTCRRSGETVRSLLDCLVAAVALRIDLPVLHRDRDFDVIGRHTDLRAEAVYG